MIPIVRACNDPRYKRVVGVLASQMGKTDNLLNVAGYRLDDDPAPILYVGPTRSNVEKVIEPRVMAMIRSAASLKARLGAGHKSTKTYKRVAGVSLRLAWAGSATELASEPACIVLIDERDRMDADVGGEGDPVELAEARNATYPDGTTIVTSTPTIGNVETAVDPDTGLEHWVPAEADDLGSAIWKLWQEGTRFEWAWPCPDCGEYFIARFKHLQWPAGSSPQQALKHAQLACPHCGVLLDDRAKSAMNARGVYVAPGQKPLPHQDGDRCAYIAAEGRTINAVRGADGVYEVSFQDFLVPVDASDCASFWVSGLCSPWRTWGQRARSFLAAVRSGSPERIQGVINTGFGELYSLRGQAPDWQFVAALRGGYEADTLPEGVQVITCGVDVQKDRLVYAIRGWGYNSESWLLRHGELWGDTAHDAVWLELAAFRDVRFGTLAIRRVAIDSGYRPGETFRRPDNQIYAFCRRHAGWAVPTKGHDKQERPLKANRIDVTIGGRVIKGGLQLWHLDTDHYKQWIHARLDWPEDQPGGWHLHASTDDDYCMQLVAEARVVKPSGHVTWQRLRKDNHFLDCEVGAVAAADMLKLWALKKRPAQADDEPAAEPKPQRRRSSYWDR